MASNEQAEVATAHNVPGLKGDTTGRGVLRTGEQHALEIPVDPRTAVIGIGANLGEPADVVRGAIHALSRTDWLWDFRSSSLYRTSPVGWEDQPAFINAVVMGTTDVPALWLLGQLQNLERMAGPREGGARWGPRALDLDLLVVGNEEISHEQLQLPHSEISNRRFVLEPLAELIPTWVHPVSGVEVRELLKRVDPRQTVERIS